MRVFGVCLFTIYTLEANGIFPEITSLPLGPRDTELSLHYPGCTQQSRRCRLGLNFARAQRAFLSSPALLLASRPQPTRRLLDGLLELPWPLGRVL